MDYLRCRLIKHLEQPMIFSYLRSKSKDHS